MNAQKMISRNTFAGEINFQERILICPRKTLMFVRFSYKNYLDIPKKCIRYSSTFWLALTNS